MEVLSLGLCGGKGVGYYAKLLLEQANLSEEDAVREVQEYLQSFENNTNEYNLLIKDDYISNLPTYFEGTLIVPASTSTKGNHAYPFYYKGKW